MLQSINFSRILMSLGLIVFVGAIAVAGTGAFFSDTETSTDNVFTAGALDLKIDSVSHYNGMVCTSVDDTYVWVPEANVTLDEENQPVAGDDMNEQTEWDAFNEANPAQYPQAGVECTGTWPLDDIGPNQANVGTFFDFDDIKPGDDGENTISIHVDNNDAWMCVSLENVGGEDPEDTATEPESEVDDSFGLTLDDSELDENLFFFAWLDDGDNIYEPGEVIDDSDDVEFSFGDPVAASDLAEGVWTLADSASVNGPIEGGTTHYIGVYWCAGEIDTNAGAGPLTCDGELMGNEAQTDSWFADLSFYIEQARNNDEFLCEPQDEVRTASLTIDKSVTFSSVNVDVEVDDFELYIDGPDGQVLVTDEVIETGLTPGEYTVSEVYVGGVAITFDATFGGSCTDDGDTGSVTLAPGDNLTCTIVNEITPAVNEITPVD